MNLILFGIVCGIIAARIKEMNHALCAFLDHMTAASVGALRPLIHFLTNTLAVAVLIEILLIL